MENISLEKNSKKILTKWSSGMPKLGLGLIGLHGAVHFGPTNLPSTFPIASTLSIVTKSLLKVAINNFKNS